MDAALVVALVLFLLSLGGGAAPARQPPRLPRGPVPPPGGAPAPTVVSLSIRPSPLTVQLEGVVTYTVTATMSDGSTQDVSDRVTSRLTPPTMGFIGAYGNLRGDSVGSGTLTVALGGATASAPVTVTAKPLILIPGAIPSPPPAPPPYPPPGPMTGNAPPADIQIAYYVTVSTQRPNDVLDRIARAYIPTVTPIQTAEALLMRANPIMAMRGKDFLLPGWRLNIPVVGSPKRRGRYLGTGNA